jgi:hypothetical protein
MKISILLLTISVCVCYSNNSLGQAVKTDTIYNSIVKYSPHPIKNSISLIKYAEPILFQIYGKKNILSEKPYLTYLAKGTWYMDGSLPQVSKEETVVGGTFHIEIRAKDGKIINVIHYK